MERALEDRDETDVMVTMKRQVVNNRRLRHSVLTAWLLTIFELYMIDTLENISNGFRS